MEKNILKLDSTLDEDEIAIINEAFKDTDESRVNYKKFAQKMTELIENKEFLNHILK